MKTLALSIVMAMLLWACHRSIPCLTADDYAKQLAAEKNNQQAKPDTYFLDKEWYCGGPAFLENNEEKMQLSTPEGMSFGHHVQFNTDGSLVGSYSAQCGNDCFTTVYGNYKMTTSSQMSVQLDSVKFSGYCDKNGTTMLNKKLVYDLQKEEKGYLLTKK